MGSLKRRARRRSNLIHSLSAEDTSPEEAPEGRPFVALQLCANCRTRAIEGFPTVDSVPNSPDVGASSPIAASPPSPWLDRTRARRKSSYREPFVGSYEESLLSGRMASVSCSPPVQFHVRIGVLGKGKYSGQCPPHLSTNFSAVFYDWKTDLGNGSPYVGAVDLGDIAGSNEKPQNKIQGYKIPRYGQIQIVVSNVERTGVHFFLIPYDLRHMPGGTKTFIRHKVYENNPKTLVQAVHLQIACPNKNRLYLYGDIRLAFQNRAAQATGLRTTAERRTETIDGGFSKYVHSAAPVAKCDQCSESISALHPSDSTTPNACTPIKPSPLSSTPSGGAKIKSRQELDTTMMGDMTASFRFL